MRKQVNCEELSVGMYVAELDRPWLETSFLFQGFEITRADEIEELQRYCQFVYVDLQQSRVANESEARQPQIETGWAPKHEAKNHVNPSRINTEEENEEARLEFEILKKQVRPDTESGYSDRTSLEEEVEQIREAFTFAQSLLPTLMEDARMGRSIKTDTACKTINAMAASIIRNPDALMCFTQLKRKDAYTAEHSVRVSILAMAFGRHMGMAREQLELLGVGALLHDIGKTRVPTEVLVKQDDLTEHENKLMRQHVAYGVQILGSTDLPAAAIEVVAQHHERHDGSGYAKGLKGGEITQFGMIGAIADYYDALTSDRPYKHGQPAHRILRDLYKFRGSKFEPGLIERFIQCIGIYPIGSIVELNSGDIGVVQTINRVRRLKPQVALVLHSDHSTYTKPVSIDLNKTRMKNGRPYEITGVHEPEEFTINPAYYLPIHAS